MSDQTFKCFPIRPGFPYSFPLGPQKTDPDNPAFPAGAEYAARITSNIDDPANGGTITTGAGEIIREDNQLTLNFPATITAALVNGGSIASFDITRTDAGNEEHLNIEVDIPLQRSITPPS